MSHTRNTFRPIPGHRQRPLMMQLALAAGAIAQPTLSKGENFGNDFWKKEGGRSVTATMEKIVAGLKMYQNHPYERPPIQRSIIHVDGGARFAWYGAQLNSRRHRARGGIVIIPSLINGCEILDILPDKRSLVRWLASQGYDVFVLEWHDIQHDPEIANIEILLSQKIPRMLDFLKSEYVGYPLFGMGYCMGGLFLAAVEIIRPQIFDALVFIATPWDFHAGATNNFAEALNSWAEEGLVKVGHLDYMPAEWLQMIFAGVDPSLVARKFTAFADMKQDSLEAQLFVAVEDWVNCGGDLPAGVVQHTVKEWYLLNKPTAGAWKVAGFRVDPALITKPSLSIIPSKDKIVPPESAYALALKIPDADVLMPECGHISMMVSAHAKGDVWQPMAGWIKDVLEKQRVTRA